LYPIIRLDCYPRQLSTRRISDMWSTAK